MFQARLLAMHTPTLILPVCSLTCQLMSWFNADCCMGAGSSQLEEPSPASECNMLHSDAELDTACLELAYTMSWFLQCLQLVCYQCMHVHTSSIVICSKKRKLLCTYTLSYDQPCACLQHQDLAVTVASQMKATADEVSEYRKRYQAKDEAVKQLRRRKMESTDSKSLVKTAADKQVLCLTLVLLISSLE